LRTGSSDVDSSLRIGPTLFFYPLPHVSNRENRRVMAKLSSTQIESDTFFQATPSKFDISLVRIETWSLFFADWNDIASETAPSCPYEEAFMARNGVRSIVGSLAMFVFMAFAAGCSDPAEVQVKNSRDGFVRTNTVREFFRANKHRLVRFGNRCRQHRAPIVLGSC
jgi:hypothetical protein